MRLALKIDVDTLRGTREGVPALARVLRERELDATFLFTLGPDNTGRALKRLFRPGFLAKVMRTSVASNYGLKTLCYGVLIPGPDIGRRAANDMRRVAAEGFEVGIHTWDHIRWQDYVARRGAEWTLAEFRPAVERFREVFGEEPHCFGAAGWQINAHALLLEAETGMRYASDCRGERPFLPVVDGETFSCPQLPTTLPTLDELIGREGITAENVADRLLELGSRPPRGGGDHVFTLHAELEGMAYLEVFEKLLDGWSDRGVEICAMRTLRDDLSLEALPRHELISGRVPGRSGTLAVQGRELAG
ncbi:MAG: polysaccharide deacetylase family protein [Gammaproteobacteria bacterium]|jgi:peptidoglycan/xylan/chitin deacetylase (PgdA/CDA1 family)